MHVAKRLIPGELIAIFLLSAFVMSSGIAGAVGDVNAVAERYAHLVLALGQHDPDYVDAFYGPAEWKTQAEKEKKSLDQIAAEAAELSATLNQDRPHLNPLPKGEADVKRWLRKPLRRKNPSMRCSNCGANICRNKFPRWRRGCGC